MTIVLQWRDAEKTGWVSMVKRRGRALYKAGMWILPWDRWWVNSELLGKDQRTDRGASMVICYVLPDKEDVHAHTPAHTNTGEAFFKQLEKVLVTDLSGSSLDLSHPVGRTAQLDKISLGDFWNVLRYLSPCDRGTGKGICCLEPVTHKCTTIAGSCKGQHCLLQWCGVKSVKFKILRVM